MVAKAGLNTAPPAPALTMAVPYSFQTRPQEQVVGYAPMSLPLATTSMLNGSVPKVMVQPLTLLQLVMHWQLQFLYTVGSTFHLLPVAISQLSTSLTEPMACAFTVIQAITAPLAVALGPV